MDAHLRLEEPLILGQQRLLQEQKLESLLGFVVVNNRRDVPKLPPIADDGAYARPGLVAQTDSAESAHDRRIAHLLFGGLQQLIHTRKRIAGIPEYSPI